MDATPIRIATENTRPITRRVNLTEAGITRLTCPANKPRVYVYDGDVKGLAVQITRSQHRSFYYYGRIKGEPRPVKFHLGEVGKVPLKTARERARKIASDAADGINPNVAKRRKAIENKLALSVKELWEAYRDKHLKVKGRASTLRTDESRYELHLSTWATRRINTIDASDVAELHRILTTTKTPNVADKAVKLLRRMLTWHGVKPNPASQAVQFHGDARRERFLSTEEIGRLFAELDKAENETAADAIRFALLTGARKGNVCAARWGDMHLSNGVWIIPKDQSKNGKPVAVSLAAPAVALLKDRAKVTGDSAYVFPGRIKDQHVKDVSQVWYAVRKAAKLDDVRFHDLRHSLASHMAMSGASLLQIGRQLGHASHQSTARYSHLEAMAVRPATELALAAMAGGKTSTELDADERNDKATSDESSKKSKRGKRP
ncbi:MAG: tyrosine-type recombinase/integrase [Tepidisphaeraceae bacterium]